MSKQYNICSRCVMDTSASNIEFDDQNHCNFCRDAIKNRTYHNDKLNLDYLISQIKKEIQKVIMIVSLVYQVVLIALGL